MGTQLLKYQKMLTTDRHINKKTPNIDYVCCISDAGASMPEMLRSEKKPEHIERVKSKVEQEYDDHIKQLYSNPVKSFPKYDIDMVNSIEEISPDKSVRKITVKEGIELDNDELKCTEGKEVTIKYCGFNLPSVLQNRTASMLDGKHFDASSSHDGGEFVITIGNHEVVPGFEVGVSTMRKGEVAVIWMSPHMAYGSRGPVSIPADSCIGFVIHVTDVRKKAKLNELDKVKNLVAEGKDYIPDDQFADFGDSNYQDVEGCTQGCCSGDGDKSH